MSERICSIEDCGQRRKSRGWCHMHYQRWLKHGDPMWEPAQYTVCSAEGCDKPPRSRTSELCEMHYYRQRRGTPMAATPRFYNETGICTVDECDGPAKGRYCQAHRARWYRHGDVAVVLPRPRLVGPSNPNWGGDGVEYYAIHQRLTRHRGRPTSCGHCGRRDDTQYHWALNWDRCMDVRCDASTGLPYSTDLEDYINLCVPCHKVFDLGR